MTHLILESEILQEYERGGGGGGGCIEYKQGTVENWLPVAANECVCVCVCVCVYLYSIRASFALY